MKSERIPTRKIWDHSIDLKEMFKLQKGKIYPLSKNEREEVQNFMEDQLRKGYIRPSKSSQMSWLGKLAKSLFIFLFFSFLIYNYKMEHGKVSCDFVTMSQWCDGWSWIVMSQVTVTRCHMTRVTWGPWENKHIATVVKCISSRELTPSSSLCQTLNKETVGLIPVIRL